MAGSKFTPEKLLKTIREASKEHKTELNLNGKGIEKLPPEISSLADLIRLDLSQNNLSELPSEIAQLRNLKYLDLSQNRFVEFPVPVTRLENLETLLVALQDQSPVIKNEKPRIGSMALPANISNLKNLKVLDLSSNQIKKLPKEFGNLQKLRSLSLSSNRITQLPEEVGNLANLEWLTLGGNNLDGLPATIAKLINLKYLLIGNNNFTNLPSEITKLEKLRVLSLVGNSIRNIPSDIRKLTRLTMLILGHTYEFGENRIDSLRNFNKLFFQETGFYILYSVDTDGYNQIKSLPDEISDLVNLRSLIISHNKLTSLNPHVRNLKNLEVLDVRDNHLLIPPEILAKINEPQTILDYYFSVVERPQKPLNEIKLLFVGQGSVGKTSLIQQIIHGTFNQNQTKTEGISINQWTIDDGRQMISSTVDSPSSIKLNIWDFGGQEIMHATHQFFLTKRSLYLLVLDARLTQEENRVEYWLKIIQSFGGESPVLIVGNKTDQHPLDIDRTGLQKKYPNIIGILETSAAIGAGIEALKAEIAKQVDILPHVRDLLPETWFTVKSKLEDLGRDKNFITQDEYLDLCSTNEVTDDTSQHTLISFLHDLGVVLHFQDDPRLEALGILNPQWVTNGVYKILNAKSLFKNKGVLTRPMLDNILKIQSYPSNKRMFIVDMMKKFELCYDLEEDKVFLVPDLLPKDEPKEINFSGIPAFQYQYPVLPSSILTRLIVRMNKNIYEKVVWRTGVLLKIGKNLALVKADIEDKKITIAIDGVEHMRRDALSAIRFQLDEIHNSIKGLDPEKRIPIPDAPNAEPLDYEYLLQLEHDGDLEVLPVKDGNRLVKVNIRQLLSGVESEAQRKATAASITNIYVGGDVKESNLIIGNENTATITKNIFRPVYRRVEKSRRKKVEKAELIAKVSEIENEVAKGEQARESFLSRRLRNLKKTAPDIADVALAALTSPGSAISTIVKKVAIKIKDETK